MIQILEAPSLAALSTVRHGFFTRQGGASEGFFASLNGRLYASENVGNVAENRVRAATALGCEAAKFLSCRQVHSRRVVRVERQWRDEDAPEADAMVTARSGMGLCILTADCAPVLFADDKAGVIGAAHAGWRGALDGILEATVAAMEDMGANRARIAAAIGPCIWQQSYEVGPEFPALFLEKDSENKRFFKEADKRGHFMFDLPGFVRAELAGAGIEAIDPSPADTFADDERFFSFRRSSLAGEKESGRLMSAIMLKGR